MQTGFVESLTAGFRDECLNEHPFRSLPAARHIIEAWRTDYNRDRLHNRPGGLKPNEFATRSGSPPRRSPVQEASGDNVTTSRDIRSLSQLIERDWLRSVPSDMARTRHLQRLTKIHRPPQSIGPKNIGQRESFRPSAASASTQPLPHNPRKQRQFSGRSRIGRRFRGTQWRGRGSGSVHSLRSTLAGDGVRASVSDPCDVAVTACRAACEACRQGRSWCPRPRRRPQHPPARRR